MAMVCRLVLAVVSAEVLSCPEQQQILVCLVSIWSGPVAIPISSPLFYFLPMLLFLLGLYLHMLGFLVNSCLLFYFSCSFGFMFRFLISGRECWYLARKRPGGNWKWLDQLEKSSVRQRNKEGSCHFRRSRGTQQGVEEHNKDFPTLST